VTELENQLREAFGAKASAIAPPPPPLELQPRPVRRLWGSGSAGTWARRRWLVPLAAAASVVAVTAVALIAGRALPAKPPRAAAPAVPPYYVAVQTSGPASRPATAASVATVRSTATGAVLATIRPPAPFTGFSLVSGAADDRTFLLLAHGAVRRNGNVWNRFYLLHIDPFAATAPKRASLIRLPVHGRGPLPVPSDWQVQAMALSPDGGSLVAVMINGDGGYLLVVYSDLWDNSGSTRAGRICPHVGLGLPGTGPSCSMVAVSWVQAQVRIGLVPGARGKWHVVQLTPEGLSVLISYRESGGAPVVLNRLSGANFGSLTWIHMPAHVTGRTNGYRILRTVAAQSVLWTSADGNEFIASGARPGQTAGIYRGRSYTPLPWPTNVIGAAW
jgi:hypothetical protein